MKKTLRRILAGLLAGLLLCAGCSFAAAEGFDDPGLIIEDGVLTGRNLYYNGEELVIPEGVTEIGRDALQSCSARRIVLPETLKKIDDYGLLGCWQIEEITLPASLEEIGMQILGYCESLKAIHVAEGNTHFTSVDGVLFTADGKQLLAYPAGREEEAYELPASTETVDPNAFSEAKFRKIVIPAGMMNISPWALSSIPLQEVEVAEDNPALKSVNGMLCSKDGADFLFWPSGRSQAEVTPEDLPEGITSVGYSAFFDAHIRRIVLPDTVTVIKGSAFNYMEDLEEVVAPGAAEISPNAFYGCKKLQRIRLGNGDAQLAVNDKSGSLSVMECPSAVIIAPAGGAVERYCSEHSLAFVRDDLPEEELAAMAAEQQRESARLWTEEKEKLYADELAMLAQQRKQEDAAWAEQWPPAGRTEAEEITTADFNDYSATVYFTPGREMDSGEDYFYPDELYGTQTDVRERVTQYHVTFLSGDEHLRALYTEGLDWEGRTTVQVNRQYAYKPGEAAFRIDMVSDHYYASVEAHPVVLSTLDLKAELLSSDVYIPVGTGVDIGELYRMNEYVKTEPRLYYTCYIETAGEDPRYGIENGAEFVAREPGDYPARLQVSFGSGYYMAFDVTVHASAETVVPYIPGEAPKSMYAEKTEQQEMEREDKQLKAAMHKGDKLIRTEEAGYVIGEYGGKTVYRYIVPRTDTVTVPGELEGNKVTGIASGAFNFGFKRDKVKVVSVGEGIEDLAEDAFSGMRGLVRVELPESLKSIGENCFNGCNALKEINLPAGLAAKDIGHNAFRYTALESLVLGDGTDLMAATLEAFRNKGPEDKDVKMTAWNNGFNYLLREDGGAVLVAGVHSSDDPPELVIPAEINGHPVKEIGKHAFGLSDELTSVTVPAGVEAIGDSAFNNCGNLKEVHLPEGLVSIGEKAFVGTALEEIRLPESTTELGKNWFIGPGRLDRSEKWSYRIVDEDKAVVLGYAVTENIKMPQKLDNAYTVIGVEANHWPLQDLAKVKSVSLPGTLTEIGDRAFAGMSSLARAKLPAKLVKIGSEAFAGTALKDIAIPDAAEAVGEGAFRGCENLQKITLSAKSVLKELGKEAFAGCAALKTVAILPESLEQIGEGVLDGHGDQLAVTCVEGSAADQYLQNNCPDVKIDYTKKKK